MLLFLSTAHCVARNFFVFCTRSHSFVVCWWEPGFAFLGGQIFSSKRFPPLPLIILYSVLINDPLSTSRGGGGGHADCPPPSLVCSCIHFGVPGMRPGATKIGDQLARFMDGCARARLNDFRFRKPSPNQIAQVHRYSQIDRRTTVQPTHTPPNPPKQVNCSPIILPHKTEGGGRSFIFAFADWN